MYLYNLSVLICKAQCTNAKPELKLLAEHRQCMPQIFVFSQRFLAICRLLENMFARAVDVGFLVYTAVLLFI